MAGTTIVQKPLATTLPVGQEVIYAVSNTDIVPNFTGVKIIAEVHISNTTAPDVSTTTDLIGTFKTTPNNSGVGMFDFRPIIESFVNADNLARKDSEYKGVTNVEGSNVPMHLIDKYSGNLNTMRWLAVKFTTQYIDATGAVVIDASSATHSLKVMNGYLKYSDKLYLVGNNFGYYLDLFENNGSTTKFLTNSPTTQYANIDDYGTMGLLMLNPYSIINPSGTVGVVFNFYKEDDTVLGTEDLDHTAANGGFAYPDNNIYSDLLFLGVYPANLQNWSTVFNTNIADISYYDFQIVDDAGHAMSALYTMNINCPNAKGFEPIRLTWLNQWGAWDYYTFNMKSTKSISTKGSTYHQLGGTWNEASYRIDSFKGGKKAFRVNATEKISMNTDFVSESDSEWFEELINSPEVYILEGFKTDAVNSSLNKYVTPVRLLTSNYTKKTVANDKLMQYTFEVEKTKTLRTQSI